MSDNLSPEQQARVLIDQKLQEAGWVVQHRDTMNLGAGRGVAVRDGYAYVADDELGLAVLATGRLGDLLDERVVQARLVASSTGPQERIRPSRQVSPQALQRRWRGSKLGSPGSRKGA